jgi:hypothetical protein
MQARTTWQKPFAATGFESPDSLRTEGPATVVAHFFRYGECQVELHQFTDEVAGSNPAGSNTEGP